MASEPDATLAHRLSTKASINKLWSWASKLSISTTVDANGIIQDPSQPPRAKANTFWPGTMEAELDKAARVLRSFTDNGFGFEQGTVNDGTGLVTSRQVHRKIPTQLLQGAYGIIIITAMRSGLWMNGAGGSGLLIARTPGGMWSQPSAVMLHSSEVGFLVGTDVYDCVLVITSREALETVAGPQWSFETDVSSAPGPVADKDGQFEVAPPSRVPEMYSYLKSRGFYTASHMDGVVVERADVNEAFYGRPLTGRDILFGLAGPSKEECRLLSTAVTAMLENIGFVFPPLSDLLPAPSDYEVEKAGLNIFGIPDVDDPDPFGVLALEREGIGLREAITRRVHPPSSEEFEFRPSPTSPIYQAFSRASMESPIASRRNSNRVSYASYLSRRRSGSTVVDPTGMGETNLPASTAPFHALAPPHSLSGTKLDEDQLSIDSKLAFPSAHHSRASTLDMNIMSLFDPNQDMIHTISEEREDIDEDGEDMKLDSISSKPTERTSQQPHPQPFPPAPIEMVSSNGRIARCSSPVSFDRPSDVDSAVVGSTPTKATDDIKRHHDDVEEEEDEDDDFDDDDFSDLSDDEEEIAVVVHQAPVTISAAQVRLVEVHLPPPPALPVRHPGRPTAVHKADSVTSHTDLRSDFSDPESVSAAESDKVAPPPTTPTEGPRTAPSTRTSMEAPRSKCSSTAAATPPVLSDSEDQSELTIGTQAGPSSTHGSSGSMTSAEIASRCPTESGTMAEFESGRTAEAGSSPPAIPVRNRPLRKSAHEPVMTVMQMRRKLWESGSDDDLSPV